MSSQQRQGLCEREVKGGPGALESLVEAGKSDKSRLNHCFDRFFDYSRCPEAIPRQ